MFAYGTIVDDFFLIENIAEAKGMRTAERNILNSSELDAKMAALLKFRKKMTENSFF